MDKLPVDDDEVADFHRALLDCQEGEMADGWGEVSYWPAERMKSGDWTPAVWRSPELAEAAAQFARSNDLIAIQAQGLVPVSSGPILRSSYKRSEPGLQGSFLILKSKSGTKGQKTIHSTPDEYWIAKNRNQDIGITDSYVKLKKDLMMKKASYLLITDGQNTSTARVTATAAAEKFVGNGWMPITGLSPETAKSSAVFINSTAGRLQLMRHPGRKLMFPTYSASEAGNISIPDIKDVRIRSILADCWERTKEMIVPQFRDGECEVRRLWDEAVAEAMGWDPDELSRLRHLLHREPHVRGLGYNQYPDAAEED
jgi:hypothetical protein